MSLDVPFRITSEMQSRAATVTVCGEIDLENVADLRSALDELVASTDGDIVIDLSEVSYLDSTGLHELLSVRSHAAALDRRLIVQRPSPAVCPSLRTLRRERAIHCQRRRRRHDHLTPGHRPQSPGRVSTADVCSTVTLLGRRVGQQRTNAHTTLPPAGR